MATFTAPASTLDAIITKVRRLTRTPSTAQLSDQEIVDYVNTFIIYDFPQHLWTFPLRQQFSFQCNPYQDVYNTDLSYPNSPLYNFQNNFVSVHEPLYIAGYQSLYSQSRTQFFGIYPLVNSILSISQTGDGSTTVFSGTLGQVPVLQNQVLFSSVDSNNNGLALVDVPVVNAITGFPTSNGNLYVPGTQPTTPPTTVNPANTINYVTGAYTLTFATAPASGQTINSQTVPYQPAIPQAMLFFENQFTLRPVPDQPYTINFEVFVRPSALLNSTSTPQLNQWWQYFAYGAAKKIFEDRADLDSVQLIMPEYKKQEALVLRATLVQRSNERVATIYTEQTGFGYGNGWGWGGGGLF